MIGSDCFVLKKYLNFIMLIALMPILECKHKPLTLRMELNDIIRKDAEEINSCILSDFEPIDLPHNNPFFPIKVNYKSINDSILFCNLSLIDCYALRNSNSYCFLILLKFDPDLVRVISKYYGNPSIEGDVKIDDRSLGNGLYIWHHESVNIYLRRDRNPTGEDKYKDCSFVAIGNMEFRELLPWTQKY
jgi:hypothetical protein